MSTGSVHYALNGNQLAQVAGGSVFAYDFMGRMTFDGHNSLSLEYNNLNRIKKVKQDTTVLANYSYLADGRKESALNGSGNGLLYVGSLIYRKTGSEIVPESAIWSEGRLIAKQDAWGSWNWVPLVHSTDRLGSVMAVRNGVTGDILERSSYSAYGDKIVLSAQGYGTTNRFHYNGKEDQSFVGVPYSDYGARMYDSSIRRWVTRDPMGAAMYHLSPFIMCSNNTINRLDFSGEWDITVHVYDNRAEYGYGIAVVTNRFGEEVFRFRVRAQGTKGRDRMIEGADTPLGIYAIPRQHPWISGKSRVSYGPYPRLNMRGVSGEIIESGRDEIRIHGGRQEFFINGKWKQKKHPQLRETQGCLRCYDSDIHSLKKLTDMITAQDSQDLPGNVIVVDDLVKELVPKSDQNMIEVQEQYVIPEECMAERVLGKLWQKEL